MCRLDEWWISTTIVSSSPCTDMDKPIVALPLNPEHLARRLKLDLTQKLPWIHCCLIERLHQLYLLSTKYRMILVNQEEKTHEILYACYCSFDLFHLDQYLLHSPVWHGTPDLWTPVSNTLHSMGTSQLAFLCKTENKFYQLINFYQWNTDFTYLDQINHVCIRSFFEWSLGYVMADYGDLKK